MRFFKLFRFLSVAEYLINKFWNTKFQCCAAWKMTVHLWKIVDSWIIQSSSIITLSNGWFTTNCVNFHEPIHPSILKEIRQRLEVCSVYGVKVIRRQTQTSFVESVYKYRGPCMSLLAVCTEHPADLHWSFYVREAIVKKKTWFYEELLHNGDKMVTATETCILCYLWLSWYSTELGFIISTSSERCS